MMEQVSISKKSQIHLVAICVRCSHVPLFFVLERFVDHGDIELVVRGRVSVFLMSLWICGSGLDILESHYLLH